MTAVVRIDRFSFAFIVDRDATPTPARGVAHIIDGALVCDGYIARDGLLRYSDGTRSWLEYRPRAALEASRASWRGAPVTDDHPPQLVNAETLARVRKGEIASEPSIEVIGDVAYMRAKIKITDRALVQSVTRSGGRRQLSIGFEAIVEPTSGEYGGQRYESMQVTIVPNHVALVDRGRAGPAVRLLGLDHAAISRAAPLWPSSRPTHDEVHRYATHLAGIRHDAVGQPTTEATVINPDDPSQVYVGPTWVAALVQEAVEARRAAGSRIKPGDGPELQRSAERIAAERREPGGGPELQRNAERIAAEQRDPQRDEIDRLAARMHRERAN